jgi:transketolase C-terminal domain/subunit
MVNGEYIQRALHTAQTLKKERVGLVMVDIVTGFPLQQHLLELKLARSVYKASPFYALEMNLIP